MPFVQHVPAVIGLPQFFRVCFELPFVLRMHSSVDARCESLGVPIVAGLKPSPVELVHQKSSF